YQNRNCRYGNQAQLGLPSANKFKIDFGQQFGVEEGAMLGATAVVNAKTRAEIVQAIRAARKFAPRQLQCVDQTIARYDRLLCPFEFSIEKAQVERRIMSDQRRIAHKRQEIDRNIREYGLRL